MSRVRETALMLLASLAFLWEPTKGGDRPVVDPIAIQRAGGSAWDLLAKRNADRPAEHGWQSEEVAILRLCIEDADFLKLAAKKINERKP